MKLKITCYTPKGKAKECEKQWRKQFPSFKKPIDKGIPNDSEFFWVYEFDKETDLYKFHKRVMLASGAIKKVYRHMIKFFTRAVNLLNRGGWRAKKAKNWLIKRWNKAFKDDKDMEEKIKKMPDTEFLEWIKLDDKEEILEFLEKEIIVTEVLE